MLSRLMKRWTIWPVISAQFKSQRLWWSGGALVQTACNSMSGIFKETIDAERNVKVLELPSSQYLFRKIPCAYAVQSGGK